VLRTRHGASQPVTPSAAYASEAEPPLLHITTLTTGDGEGTEEEKEDEWYPPHVRIILHKLLSRGCAYAPNI